MLATPLVPGTYNQCSVKSYRVTEKNNRAEPALSSPALTRFYKGCSWTQVFPELLGRGGPRWVEEGTGFVSEQEPSGPAAV